jgi:hypothetical protein
MAVRKTDAFRVYSTTTPQRLSIRVVDSLLALTTTVVPSSKLLLN